MSRFFELEHGGMRAVADRTRCARNEVQGKGYLARALGFADVLVVFHFRALRYRVDDSEWEGWDRPCLSFGDYATVLYGR